jgi:hypothetical protein
VTTVEYANAAEMVAAARALRARGVTRIEAYTPYHVEELDEVIGARRSRLAVAAAVGAICGGIGAYALEWLFAVYLYPINTGARALHMPFAYVPIAIEMAFLGAALTVVGALVWRAGLGKYWHPVFDVPGIESATRAGFWLAYEEVEP